MHSKLKFHGLKTCSHSVEQTYNQFVFKSPRRTVFAWQAEDVFRRDSGESELRNVKKI